MFLRYYKELLQKLLINIEDILGKLLNKLLKNV